MALPGKEEDEIRRIVEDIVEEVEKKMLQEKDSENQVRKQYFEIPGNEANGEKPLYTFGFLSIYGVPGIEQGMARMHKLRIRNCAVCKTQFKDNSEQRPLQDSCGHFRCRMCFVVLAGGCPICDGIDKCYGYLPRGFPGKVTNDEDTVWSSLTGVVRDKHPASKQ